MDRFNEESDTINLVFEDALTAGLVEDNQKLRIAMENDAGPDIVGGIDVGANLQALVATGKVMDLTEFYRTTGLIERIPANLREPVTIDGRIYAIPQNMESVGIFYNKDIFAELDWRYRIPMKIMSACWKRQRTPAGYAMGLGGGWPSALMASEFMYISAGTEYIEVLSGNQPWTECAACLDGLNAFYDLVANGYTNPDILGIDYNQAIDLFYQGQTAMVLNGPWFLNDLFSTDPEFEVGFFYLPPVNPDTDIKTIGLASHRHLRAGRGIAGGRRVADFGRGSGAGAARSGRFGSLPN